jgi:hypothetical protein
MRSWGQLFFRLSCASLSLVIAGGLGLSGPTAAQESKPELEFMGQFYAPLDAPQVVAGDLFIYNVATDREGWFKGPKLNAKPVAPCADWLQLQPDGNFWLDVRCTLKTDDDALIYLEYSGVIDWGEKIAEKCNGGGEFTGSEMYFRTNPKFQTIAENYAWLNSVQAVGTMTAVKCGEDSYVQYDFYAVK